VLEQGSGDGSAKFSWTHARIFYLNIPVSVLCFVGVATFLNLQARRSSFALKVRRIDWLGIGTFMASTTSLLFGITVGGTVYDWVSFRTIMPIALGTSGLFVFAVIEKYISKEPMIPLIVFASRTAASAYVGIFLHGLVSPIQTHLADSRPCGI